MTGVLEGSERLEGELAPEPWKGPAAGAVALHLALVAGVVLYGIIGGFFRHSMWGGAASGGAIQVNLVSSAIPLPSDQPPNQNVLATETPSQAPAPPAPKAKQAEDETAIPIAGRQKKHQQETVRRTPPRKQEPVQNNRAAYGEQAGSSMPRVTEQGFSSGPTTVSDSSFGSLFAYYVDGINRKMSQNWYKPEVDPHTPRGSRAYVLFRVYRDGSVGDVRLDRSSGSPTLDNSCVRAAQRVDTFGNLPSAYRGSYLMISYYCEY